MKNNLLGHPPRIKQTFFIILAKSLYSGRRPLASTFLKQGVLNRKGRPKAAHDISSTNKQIHYDAYLYTSKRFTQ